MSKKILGLDLGTNSIGWAFLEAEKDKPSKIIDLGSRIFIKAVEDKTPTPKNVKRRDSRLARRVIQRRARRKQRMLNYLVKLGLLPKELQGNNQPEIILNEIGDPYQLRTKALDHPLTKHELGRVMLHFVQRRGFLSNRKTMLGDMIDDPDVLDVLTELESVDDNSSERAKEETAFKKDIEVLRNTIQTGGFRTLGEYLASFDHHQCKRNRNRDGGHLRTDRQMYRNELDLIWQKQKQFHGILTDNVKDQVEEIIFFQRPLKLRSDRIGKCSLEPEKKRANMGRLEVQRFRYLQDINNLTYLEAWEDKYIRLDSKQRSKLINFFENNASVTFARIKKELNLSKNVEFNLEQGNKKLKGNITACEIRSVYPEWDNLDKLTQLLLVEDLLTIQKKSILKKRLIDHWQFDANTAVKLCMLEFEHGHSNLSLKAINKLLPHLEQGDIYSDARQKAGYGYEIKEDETIDRLPMPPEIPNPIVQKGLHELRRLINAIIAEYGRPDAIRIEMARDLEMNTKKYRTFLQQQKANTAANDEATKEFQIIASRNQHLGLSKYPSRIDKIKYRLWKDQDGLCAYSGQMINLSTLFSDEIEIDHILPYSLSLDDSYMNKVVSFTGENRFKGQKTPIEAYGSNEEKWEQIVQRISRWDKKLGSKRERFYKTSSDLAEKDFISNQLNDTRYISRVALSYLKQLGSDITVSKGTTTAWIRHGWGLNNIIGETNEKDRGDHRHHAIDAVVIACIDRAFYQGIVRQAKDIERSGSSVSMKDLHFDPPWLTLRDDLTAKLTDVIVSHDAQRKLSGALHEETGVGFIEGKGSVYRANLNVDFKPSYIDSIIDDATRELVRQHLEKYNGNPKEAFAEDNIIYHKDGKTPIKRVRVLQASMTRKKIDETKFGIRNKEGKTFKWHAYGNLHHVEILKNIKTGKLSGVFVTMMEAHKRGKGIGVPKQDIIKTDHGSAFEFVMALHINDLVSIENNGSREFYRVQKLENPGRITLREHTASTLDNNNEMIRKSISSLMTDYKLAKHQINIIGKQLE